MRDLAWDDGDDDVTLLYLEQFRLRQLVSSPYFGAPAARCYYNRSSAEAPVPDSRIKISTGMNHNDCQGLVQ